jgi:hypothetical protein
MEHFIDLCMVNELFKEFFALITGLPLVALGPLAIHASIDFFTLEIGLVLGAYVHRRCERQLLFSACRC